jgi:hypothetical protein
MMMTWSVGQRAGARKQNRRKEEKRKQKQKTQEEKQNKRELQCKKVAISGLSAAEVLVGECRMDFRNECAFKIKA